ncbi:hypothetical protein Taro_023688, partial [Colocasia esculenta]|nr:hypothetical protein [Colocasia esculenta]
MARGRSSYQNMGSRETRSRQSRVDSREQVPPVDVVITPTGGVPIAAAPAIVPATAQEVAELLGQMQHLAGVCQGLQAQLARQPALVIPPPPEQQAESSRRRSRAPPTMQDQHAESPGRSRRAPSAQRQDSSPRSSAVVPPALRSVVGANSHKSRREESAQSDQELSRHLRRVVDLERRVDAMVQKAEGKASVDEDLDFHSPFTMEILKARVSPKLPLPTIAPYDGTTDPAYHIHGFESHMVFHGASYVAKCWAFPATLKETARAWFEALPAGSISSFHQLKKSFRDNFLGERSQPRTTASLLSVWQKKCEALWDYVKQFQTEALRIPRLNVPLATSALIQGTRDGFLQRTLGRHAVCEQVLAADRAEQGDSSDKKRPSDNGSDRDRKKGQRNGDTPRRPRPFTDYTPLTVAPEQILAEIWDEPYVRWPPRMHSDPRRRNQDKYCRFHRDHGHDTSECCQLKDEIESLIKRGYLGRYVRRNEDRQRRRERTPEQPINNEPNGQEINVIARGFGAGGESNQSRRDYARWVHVVDRPPVPRPGPYPPNPSRARSEEAITFSDEDLVGVSTPHTDALVVSATINNCTVRQILVDNGSAPDVLAYDCFLLMGLKTDQLTPVESPMFSFSGVSVQPMGQVRLPITLGTAPKSVTKMVDFLVIRSMPGYNAILGRGLIGRIKVVPSSLHQKMKFPTPCGVGEVLGSQHESRQCYVLSLRDKQTAPAITAPPIDQPSTRRGTPAEDLLHVRVDDNPEHLASSGDIAPSHSIFIEDLASLSIEVDVAAIEAGPPAPNWMDPLMAYLLRSELPSNQGEARKIRLRSQRFTLLEHQMYRRSLTRPLLRYLSPTEAASATEEVREGLCGSHLGGRTLARSIIRAGFWWPSLQKDYMSFFRRCPECQKFGQLIKKPANNYTPCS